MTQKQFNNYMTAIFNGIDAGDNHHSENDNLVFNQHGRWALKKLETLDDKDCNLRRWLNGKPCRFTSDKTGEKIEINIGKDYEAMFSLKKPTAVYAELLT